MQAAAIIVAAGRGIRAGGNIPKQYRDLCGRPVLEHTIEAFARHGGIARIIVVTHPDDTQLFATCQLPKDGPPIDRVLGGATRDASVRCGLDAVGSPIDAVLIHDAARPLVSARLIDSVLSALDSVAGAAPALGVTDALWRGRDGHVTGIQDRSGLFRAQTPQGFRLDAIRAAHAARTGPAADDVEVALAHQVDVRIVEGDADNIKITAPDDFARAEAILRRRTRAMDIRTGNGYDVHRFGPGEAVRLCGVTIPHDQGLVGHSDADVGMHALTDAIYGALADGDIGQHFPPSDPQWKGVDSRVFLEHAVARAASRGLRLGNADVTLICEQPKIGPHAAAMRAALATAIGIGEGRISVKATTSEKLGFTGRGEGIAALASVTLMGA